MPGLAKHIADGSADLAWFDVPASHEGDFAIFRMLVDAPRVGGVRLTVTAEEALECAWHIGACLPTPRLLDLRWAACTRCKVDPQPKNYRGGVGMDTPGAERQHSQRIDAAIGGAGGAPVSNVGKHWVTSRKATVERAVLYGWHVPELGTWRGIPLHLSASLPGIGVIQPESTAHGWHHHDYSSTLMLTKSDVRVLKQGEGWQALTLRDVLTDERLCGLACHDGPFTDVELLRRPGV